MHNSPRSSPISIPQIILTTSKSSGITISRAQSQGGYTLHCFVLQTTHLRKSSPSRKPSAFSHDFATTLFPAKHPMSNQFLPLSSGEEVRLQRALLRFQLYCQLFHSPQDYKKCYRFGDWERRYLAQHWYWTRFERMEIEECKSIYHLLVSYLSEHPRK